MPSDNNYGRMIVKGRGSILIMDDDIAVNILLEKLLKKIRI